MAKKEYREIVTKAVIGKGTKSFETTHSTKTPKKPTTILGLWVINHTFKGKLEDKCVKVDGSFDVNIWYSCNDNKETEVVRDTITYEESIDVDIKDTDYEGDTDVIVRVVKGPICNKAEIEDYTINYTIEKIITTEIVGDTKITIGVETPDETEKLDDEIKDSINDNFLG